MDRRLEEADADWCLRGGSFVGLAAAGLLGPAAPGAAFLAGRTDGLELGALEEITRAGLPV